MTILGDAERKGFPKPFFGAACKRMMVSSSATLSDPHDQQTPPSFIALPCFRYLSIADIWSARLLAEVTELSSARCRGRLTGRSCPKIRIFSSGYHVIRGYYFRPAMTLL